MAPAALAFVHSQRHRAPIVPALALALAPARRDTLRLHTYFRRDTAARNADSLCVVPFAHIVVENRYIIISD
jgi:hypothetical protein